MLANTIYVAGATGYIGREVVLQALNLGYVVHASARRQGQESLPDHRNLIVDIIDAQKGQIQFNIPKGASVISCLASRTGTAQDAERIDHRLNLALLSAAKSKGAAMFIMLSAICVQKPRLAFQHSKLKFEAALQASDMTFVIVRPTAYFKSLTGQIHRLRKKKSFLIFGTGKETACMPISKRDLALFMIGTISRPNTWNSVLPIGGPKPAFTPVETAQMISKIFATPAKTRSVSPRIFDILHGVLAPIRPFSHWAREKSELMKIGKYYATESMLVWDATQCRYDTDATPSTGNDTFYDHLLKIRDVGSIEMVDKQTRLF